MTSNSLLYPSVGIAVASKSVLSSLHLIVPAAYNPENPASLDIHYVNGIAQIVLGSLYAPVSTTGNPTYQPPSALAPLWIFDDVNNALVLKNSLLYNGSNKILVGDLLNNGDLSIALPAFTDTYPLTYNGELLLNSGSNQFSTQSLGDLQTHGPSIGQFIPGGLTYIAIPVLWPNSEQGTWLEWIDPSTQALKKVQVSNDISGPSSAIISATSSSGAYLFVGQSHSINNDQGVGVTYDSIIPITVDGSGAPSVDPTRAVQYINDYWNTSAHNALALTYQSVVTYNQQNPQTQINNSHVVDAVAVDINGDGLPDIISAQAYRGPSSWVSQIVIDVQQKNGTFIDQTDQLFTDYQVNEEVPYKLFVTDINHDGHPDIIFGTENWNYPGTTPSTSGDAIYLNDGTGHFVRAAADTTLAGLFKYSQIAPIQNSDGSISFLILKIGGYNNPAYDISLTTPLSFFTGPNGSNPALRGAPGFNEWYYLHTYIDAANAVTAGTYATGLDYYLAVGKGRGDAICAPNTVIYGSSGTDNFAGNNGVMDQFTYEAKSTQFNITPSATGSVIIDTSGVFGANTFHGVDRLQFSDANIALDIGPTQTAGAAYMLYQATFNRTPDAAGLGYWIAQLDKGANIITNVAATFVTSPEFIAKYGSNPTNAAYVDNLYQNVLHRAGDSGGVTYWNQQLNSGAATKAFVLEQFATLPEGAANVAPTIAHGITYTQWVG